MVTLESEAPAEALAGIDFSLTEEQRAAMLTGVPLARPGEADEIGATIAFLASDEAGYITGQTIRVNGGMYM